MFPTLRDAGSQLLFVTNAEITLEILSVLHYKSVGFGRPTARELQTSRCERKGQQVKDAIHELDLHRGGVIVSTLCESVHFSEEKREPMNSGSPHPEEKDQEGGPPLWRGTCGGRGAAVDSGCNIVLLFLIPNFMTRSTSLIYWARPPFWWKWNPRYSQDNTLQQTQCL